MTLAVLATAGAAVSITLYLSRPRGAPLNSPAPAGRVNLNSGSGTSIVWPANVQKIAANFNCPCEQCGIIRLDECTCDIARGAVEVKTYIQNLLKQNLPEEEIIKSVDKRYGHRI